MRMLGRIIRATTLALFASATLASAQDAPPSLDAAARNTAIAAAATALRERYVFPNIGAQAAAAIEAALAAGDYDDLSDPHAFAEALTTDLRGVTHDRHVNVRAHGPAPAAGAAAPAPPPRSLGGVTRADRLAGNIGYIEVISFPSVDFFALGFDQAMASLADTRALIIDIRRNGGGSPDSVSYLVSHFLGSGAPVHINSFVTRTPGTETFQRREFWSSATPSSYLAKPVYVLTSNRTFSAGEEFAYDMQAMQLGVLVGETTGGGANPGGTVPLPGGLTMFVPDGRAENPITRTNWEGVGVTPEVTAPADRALQAALEQLGVVVSVTDIDALSEERLFTFTPRATARPGAEAAVRRMIEELARGAPDYELLSEDLAEITRDQLPSLQQNFARLGAINSITFHSVDLLGADVFNVVCAGGSVSYAVMLTDDGKVVFARFGPPLPAQ